VGRAGQFDTFEAAFRVEASFVVSAIVQVERTLVDILALSTEPGDLVPWWAGTGVTSRCIDTLMLAFVHHKSRGTFVDIFADTFTVVGDVIALSVTMETVASVSTRGVVA